MSYQDENFQILIEKEKKKTVAITRTNLKLKGKRKSESIDFGQYRSEKYTGII